MLRNVARHKRQGGDGTRERRRGTQMGFHAAQSCPVHSCSEPDEADEGHSTEALEAQLKKKKKESLAIL
jgi:hypothetical protein